MWSNHGLDKKKKTDPLQIEVHFLCMTYGLRAGSANKTSERLRITKDTSGLAAHDGDQEAIENNHENSEW